MISFISGMYFLMTFIFSIIVDLQCSVSFYSIYCTNEPFHRKETHGLGVQTCDCQGGGGGRGSGMNWESRVNRFKQLHLEWINNEILLYGTGYYV